MNQISFYGMTIELLGKGIELLKNSTVTINFMTHLFHFLTVKKLF